MYVYTHADAYIAASPLRHWSFVSQPKCLRLIKHRRRSSKRRSQLYFNKLKCHDFFPSYRHPHILVYTLHTITSGSLWFSFSFDCHIAFILLLISFFWHFFHIFAVIYLLFLVLCNCQLGCVDPFHISYLSSTSRSISVQIAVADAAAGTIFMYKVVFLVFVIL